MREREKEQAFDWNTTLGKRRKKVASIKSPISA